MRAVWIGLGMGIVFMACEDSNGPTHVEISGKTPTEGAAIAAQAICAHDARCGHLSISCEGSGMAGGNGGDATSTMTCTGTIRPVSRDDCYADASEDIAQLLTCAAPTADQIDILETCFDMLASVPCVTQAQADERARAAEMGVSPPATEFPAACALLAEPPPGCQGAPSR